MQHLGLSILFISLISLSCASKQETGESPAISEQQRRDAQRAGSEANSAGNIINGLDQMFIFKNGAKQNVKNIVNSTGADVVIFQFGAPNCYTCGPELVKVNKDLVQSSKGSSIYHLSVVPGAADSFSQSEIQSWINSYSPSTPYSQDLYGTWQMVVEDPVFPTILILNKEGRGYIFRGEEDLYKAVPAAESLVK